MTNTCWGLPSKKKFHKRLLTVECEASTVSGQQPETVVYFLKFPQHMLYMNVKKISY